jgi:rhodanese-related sulfurtransferase
MPTRRRFLILGTTALIGAGFAYPLVYPAFGGTSLDAETAFHKVETGEIILIDIRRPDEWAATGIAKGAHPLDLRRKDFIAELTRIAGGDLTRPIALICARGVRSARTANLLSDNGFSAIINIPEGMLGSSDGPGWIARGLPLAAK